MFFLKFLSSVSLSLLFVGNVAAECVDLSGTYLCENDNETITLTKTSNDEGMLGYSVSTKVNGEERILPFNLLAYGMVPTTTCTENQIETEAEEPNAGAIKLTAMLQGEMLTLRIAVDVSDGRPTAIREDICRRQ